MAALLELGTVERRHPAADGGFSLRVPLLTLEHGECVAVLGPSGSGKSTLLDLIAFLAAPDRAERFVFRPNGVGHDIAAIWQDGARRRLTALRSRHLGYVLQTGGLLPYLTVRENVQLSRRLLGLPVPGPVPDLAEAVGIGGLLDRRPGQLSIGQRQRVAVVRALAHGPALILADEPTAALDGEMAVRVIDTLVAAADWMRASLVIVTHDLELAERAGGRVVRCRPVQGAVPATSVVEG